MGHQRLITASRCPHPIAQAPHRPACTTPGRPHEGCCGSRVPLPFLHSVSLPWILCPTVCSGFCWVYTVNFTTNAPVILSICSDQPRKGDTATRQHHTTLKMSCNRFSRFLMTENNTSKYKTKCRWLNMISDFAKSYTMGLSIFRNRGRIPMQI